jgi:hypothetical protein
VPAGGGEAWAAFHPDASQRPPRPPMPLGRPQRQRPTPHISPQLQEAMARCHDATAKVDSGLAQIRALREQYLRRLESRQVPLPPPPPLLPAVAAA